jgi:uncharacterized hydrophobic protein (TIGR00341 family)
MARDRRVCLHVRALLAAEHPDHQRLAVSLRLIEAVLPVGSDVGKVLAEHEVIGRWTEALDDRLALIRVLVPAERTEAVSDALCDQFGDEPVFRLMLLPVEGTLPKLEEPEKTETAAPAEAEQPRVPDRVSREELYQDIESAARLSHTYTLGVALSTVVAAVGLVADDVAVIIGAMVIAPLLGPNVALALATTLGDRDLAVRAARVSGAGVVTASLISILAGVVILLFFPDLAARLGDIPAIASRSRVGPEHVLLGLAAGSAGALAFTTGIPAVLIGVMVAVALLPPTVVAGLLLGSGDFVAAGGALALVLTNVACINLAGVLTFMAQRVRPRTWWEEEKARRASRVAIVLWAMTLVVMAVAVLLKLAGA